MVKQEFKDYLKFLGRLFPNAKIPGVTINCDFEILDIWYDGFKGVNFEIAKEKTAEYFRKEKIGFNYARLLDYVESKDTKQNDNDKYFSN